MNKELYGRLDSFYSEMSPTERKIADYLKKADSNACYLSIQELAKEIDVSPSAISRFTKRVGFNNYQELRLMLVDSQEPSEEVFFPEIDEHDSIMNIAQASFQNGISSLSSTLAILNERSWEKLLVNVFCALHSILVFQRLSHAADDGWNSISGRLRFDHFAYGTK